MSLPYYKRFPRDFFEGTIGMGFETKCAYGLVLDMIYMRDGRLPDDARYISGMLGCSVRKWNSIRSELVEHGKLICENGIISNFRADYLCEERRTYQDKQAENRSRPNKNNKIKSPASPPKHHHTEPEEEVSTSSEVDTPCEVQQAFDAYVKVAARLKAERGDTVWPVNVTLTAERRARLKARLKEHGLSAWGTVLRKAAASPHCTGANGWAADFDFLTSKKGFLKTLEGNYDDRTAKLRPINGGRSEQPQSSGGSAGAFARFAERLEGDAAREDVGGFADASGEGGGVIDAEYTYAAG